MRINKYISETGYCSRRETDRLILAGRITINGITCEAGDTVMEGGTVLIDGRAIPPKRKTVYIALNKPVGITCTAASNVKDNIMDFMNFPDRIFPIGRLDKASEGLILLTNDGAIVNKMMRSENGHEKEYVVKVDKPFDAHFILGMSQGVEILGVTTKQCLVEKIGDLEFRIVLTQGLNRQIRRMCKTFGYKVERLERKRIMNVTALGLGSGEWRFLTEMELDELLSRLG
ncbi:pseudouridine synthase [Metabacillus idriensis]|uniref:pseudouridine synthase n=1 Tax=Metabacillus idriensis TaxID=324768 RepID=UPI00174BBB69|nr:pseudouridine synthase [Metabacillus idriensis]